MIFARERTQGVWRILEAAKCAKHEEAESNAGDPASMPAGPGGKMSERPSERSSEAERQ